MDEISRKKIAIFDDDEDLLFIIKYYFAENNWIVDTYASCENIVEILQEIKPDVVLIDNWIPKIGGVASTRLLKTNDELKHIPVIFFSANNNVELLAANAGADCFIQKPFDIIEMESLVKSLTFK